MEEIKVGEYVRTIYGEIAKITQVHPRIKGIKRKAQGLIDFNLIKKHSKNIIDLIECGDIVHIKDVLHEDITYIWSENYLKVLQGHLSDGIKLIEILTHEQFEQNSYKV